MHPIALCLIFAVTVSASCRASEEDLAGLKARLATASVDQRVDLCIRIADHRLHEADKFYTDGHVEEARAAVDDVATYAEQARDAAIQSKKHLKNVEIDTRKMAEKLRDIKRTLAFEDQPPVEQAIRRLEEVRTSLLNEMFSNKKEKK